MYSNNNDNNYDDDNDIDNGNDMPASCIKVRSVPQASPNRVTQYSVTTHFLK